MKKKTALILAAIVVLCVTVMTVIALAQPELSQMEKTMISIGESVQEMGYEFSAFEKLYEPVIYSDNEGNEIVYQRYYCSDPERITDGKASYYENVFDPQSAESTQGINVGNAEALLCEKEGRHYLLWYPTENTILMLDYNPDAVSFEDIQKMAESCQVEYN